MRYQDLQLKPLTVTTTPSLRACRPNNLVVFDLADYPRLARKPRTLTSQFTTSQLAL